MLAIFFSILSCFSYAGDKNIQAKAMENLEFSRLNQSIELIKYKGRKTLTYDEIMGEKASQVIYREQGTEVGLDSGRQHGSSSYIRTKGRDVTVLFSGATNSKNFKQAAQDLGHRMKVLIKVGRMYKNGKNSESPYYIQVHDTKTGVTQPLRQFVEEYGTLMEAQAKIRAKAVAEEASLSETDR